MTGERGGRCLVNRPISVFSSPAHVPWAHHVNDGVIATLHVARAVGQAG